MNYKWAFDKNIPFSSEDDQAILSQLPEHTRQTLLKNFVFADFDQKFKSIFRFPNKEALDPKTLLPRKHCYLTWEDIHYREFMFKVYNFLEPR